MPWKKLRWAWITWSSLQYCALLEKFQSRFWVGHGNDIALMGELKVSGELRHGSTQRHFGPLPLHLLLWITGCLEVTREDQQCWHLGLFFGMDVFVPVSLSMMRTTRWVEGNVERKWFFFHFVLLDFPTFHDSFIFSWDVQNKPVLKARLCAVCHQITCKAPHFW